MAATVLEEPLVLELLLARPIDFRDLRGLILTCKACRVAASAEMTALYLSSDGERYITKQDWRILVRMLRWLGTRVVELNLSQRLPSLWDLGDSFPQVSTVAFPYQKRSRTELKSRAKARRSISAALAVPSVGALTVIAIRCPNLQVLLLRGWCDGACDGTRASAADHLPSWFSEDGRPAPVVSALSRLPQLKLLHLDSGVLRQWHAGGVPLAPPTTFHTDHMEELHAACPLLVATNFIFSSGHMGWGRPAGYNMCRPRAQATLIGAAKHLVKLHLHELCSDDFPSLAVCTHLIHLQFDRVYAPAVGGCVGSTTFAALAQHMPPCLEVLDISNVEDTRFLDAGPAGEFGSLRRLPLLQRLDLPTGATHTAPPGCAATLCGSFPALRSLNVSGLGHFGDDAMTTLFRRSPQLVELRVGYTRVTKASFEAIRTMGELLSLRVLQYENEMFEVPGVMDDMVALPEMELLAREEADTGVYGREEAEDLDIEGETTACWLAAGYSYLRTVRDRRLCSVCDVEKTAFDGNPLAFTHPLD